MRLYVIGNGFDIRHGLPTRFCCFEAYVKRHNQMLYESISNFVPTEDEWNDLESALGNFDYDGAFEENSGFLMSPGDDEWRDSANHDFPYEIEQITQRLIKELPLALRDWINAIDLSRALTPPSYIPSINRDSYFFTFNYTNTLQDIYGVPDENILHIHGNAKIGQNLVIGHDVFYENSLNTDYGPDQDIRVSDAYDHIDNYFKNSYKPTDVIIDFHKENFLRYSEVDEVLVLGHSLASVDGPYFTKISQSISKNATWVLAKYPGEKKAGNLSDYGINPSNIFVRNYEDLI